MRKNDQNGLHFHWKNKAYFTCGTLERKSAKSAMFCEICEKVEFMEIYEKVRKVRNLRKSAKSAESMKMDQISSTFHFFL